MNNQWVESLRNEIDIKVENNEKDYLKCTSKPSYILHKIIRNRFVGIRKSKFVLNKAKQTCIQLNVFFGIEVNINLRIPF